MARNKAWSKEQTNKRLGKWKSISCKNQCVPRSAIQTETISKFILKWKLKENEKKSITISHPYPDNQTVLKTRKNEEQSDNITLNKDTWKCSLLARFARFLVSVFLPLKKTKGLLMCLPPCFCFFSPSHNHLFKEPLPLLQRPTSQFQKSHSTFSLKILTFL